MDKRLSGLNLLLNFRKNDWKIGKSDLFINTINSKVSGLPDHVFSNFYISNTSKQISTIDFALMTYDMGISEKNRLMELYGIDSDSIDKILSVADDISAFLESIDEEVEESNVQPAYSIHKKTTLNKLDDEIEL